MRKVLATLAAMVILSFGTAQAAAIMIDLTPTGVTGDISYDANNQTTLFDQLSIYAETTSVPTGPNTFNDTGDMLVTAFLYSDPVDSEGLYGNNLIGNWEMTARWTNLVGSIVSQTGPNSYGGITDNYSYSSGDLEIWVSAANNHKFNNDGGLNDGSDDDEGFEDTVSVGTLSLINGNGSLDYNGDGDPVSGDITLVWKFTAMLPGFWLDADGNPLDPSMPFVIAIADTNTDEIRIALNDRDQVVVYSNHDGSVKIDVVPEPATMLLLGSGLLGLAGVGARKKFKA